MRKIVATTALLLLGALAVCVVFGPLWIIGDGVGLTPVERLGAQNDVRSTLLQGLGGFLALGGAVIAAVMTLNQVRANREGRATDLFVKAIEMLASDQPSVRHGGVYALEQLPEIDIDDRFRGHAHALLTAYIRQHAPWPAEKPPGVADDVAAALAVLGRQALILDGAWSELERVDLREADLEELTIPRACFAHSTLAGARLAGADLTGAVLRDTDLTHADLTGADLTGATLLGADLTDARLDGAIFRNVVSDATTRWPGGFTAPRSASAKDKP